MVDIGFSRVEALGPARAEVGEGPHWDASTELLWWVDLLAGLVHNTGLHSQRLGTWSLGRPVGAVIKRESGGFVVADSRGFSYLGADGAQGDEIAVLRAGHRMNDAKADPAGWLWSGSTAMDFSAGQGALWVLRPDGGAEQVLDGLTLPNGLGWSPDGETFYLVDTLQGWLRAWDFSPGVGITGGPRPIVEFTDPAQIPDGLCVDGEGTIWLAIWGGSRLERYGPEGTLLGTVPLPVAQPSSCTFGGPDLGTLLVTSARRGLGERATDLDGAVLAISHPSAFGLPTAHFAG
jgi:sugar lactone lactonase YvrE